jgi:hypothetical protein
MSEGGDGFGARRPVRERVHQRVDTNQIESRTVQRETPMERSLPFWRAGSLRLLFLEFVEFRRAFFDVLAISVVAGVVLFGHL